MTMKRSLIHKMYLFTSPKSRIYYIISLFMKFSVVPTILFSNMLFSIVMFWLPSLPEKFESDLFKFLIFNYHQFQYLFFFSILHLGRCRFQSWDGLASSYKYSLSCIFFILKMCFC